METAKDIIYNALVSNLTIPSKFGNAKPFSVYELLHEVHEDTIQELYSILLKSSAQLEVEDLFNKNSKKKNLKSLQIELLKAVAEVRNALKEEKKQKAAVLKTAKERKAVLLEAKAKKDLEVINSLDIEKIDKELAEIEELESTL